MGVLGRGAVSYERGAPILGQTAPLKILNFTARGAVTFNETAEVHYVGLGVLGYRGTSLMRNTPLLGPYRRPMPRVLGGS